MARIEFPEELQKRIQDSGPVDLIVGVTGPADVGALRAKAAACLNGVAGRTVIAYAGAETGDSANEAGVPLQFAAYPMPSTSGIFAFWTDIAEAQRSVVALASAWQARACLVIHSDLLALEAETVRLFVEQVLAGNSDLAMPVYPDGKYDGLINKSILAPLCRALYGRRVSFPLPFDFCAGANMLAKIAERELVHMANEPQLLWPSDVVARNGGQICEAVVNVRHAAQAGGLDLSAVLTELAGSLFLETEACAADWQRVRGSQPVRRFGTPSPQKEDAEPIDSRPMVESFVLGSRNLEEVWRLVLPPATMLELRHLARLDAEHFRMPDALWARIIYDFALAHRMRRVSRTHVLGALTPLYLGWLASYTQEVGGASVQVAESRIEQLARAYEDQKPYFVSRWRWPERVS